MRTRFGYGDLRERLVDFQIPEETARTLKSYIMMIAKVASPRGVQRGRIAFESLWKAKTNGKRPFSGR